MKIVGSVRKRYYESREIYELLKSDVDTKVKQLIKPRWHYESRLKEIESFTQKIETGQYGAINNLDDFFACTIVVTKLNEIGIVEGLIGNNFEVVSRRPAHKDRTSKEAHSFVFDDLRLQVHLKEDPALPPKAWNNKLFEIQVKTFLQHAWAIATHDLTYKTDNPNWAKERIAFQIKAMLEHAELSIGEIESLAVSNALAKENEQMREIRAGVKILRKHFKTDQLPIDVLRLSANIIRLLKKVGLDANVLDKLLEEERERLGTALPLNLSPFLVIVQALMNLHSEKMHKFLKKTGQSYKILIPEEVEVPENINRNDWKNAIRFD